MHTRESIRKRFAEVNVIDTFGTRKEILELPYLLGDDEVLHYATSGEMNGVTWLMVCTDLRVLLVDCGLFFGAKTHEVPLDQVTDITGEKGLYLGSLTVAHDSGEFVVDHADKDSIDVMVRTVLEQRELFKNRPVPVVPVAVPMSHPVDTESPRAVLHEWKTMLREGLVTEEEFEVKRKALLEL